MKQKIILFLTTRVPTGKICPLRKLQKPYAGNKVAYGMFFVNCLIFLCFKQILFLFTIPCRNYLAHSAILTFNRLHALD